MRLLVTGASGFFGWNFCRRHASRFDLATAWHERPPAEPGLASFQVDLGRPGAVDELWEAARPEAVLHLAARTAIDDCETNPSTPAVNAGATAELARRAAAEGARLVHVSTDLVFDGTSPPYREDDPPRPISAYGRTKAAGERAVLEASPRHLVCRVSLAYGPTAGGGIRQVDWILREAREGRPVRLFTDEFRTPIDSLTLADALAEVLERDDVTGILHLAGTERRSRYDFGRALLERCGLDPGLARPAERSEAERRVRPADVSLDTTRARGLLSTRLVGAAEGLDRILDQSSTSTSSSSG